MRGRAEQVAEARECERTDHVAVEARQHVTICILLDVDAEMVLPEINQQFGQLSLAVSSANHCGALQLRDDHLRVAWRRSWRWLHLWRLTWHNNYFKFLKWIPRSFIHLVHRRLLRIFAHLHLRVRSRH